MKLPKINKENGESSNADISKEHAALITNVFKTLSESISTTDHDFRNNVLIADINSNIIKKELKAISEVKTFLEANECIGSNTKYMNTQSQPENSILRINEHLSAMLCTLKDASMMITQLNDISKLCFDQTKISLESVNLESIFDELCNPYYTSKTDLEFEIDSVYNTNLYDKYVVKIDKEAFIRIINIMINTIDYLSGSNKAELLIKANNNGERASEFVFLIYQDIVSSFDDDNSILKEYISRNDTLLALCQQNLNLMGAKFSHNLSDKERIFAKIVLKVK